jgi:isohexenylglutaconyl-CoA hydratase
MRLPETRVVNLDLGTDLTATIDDPATRNALSDALLADLLSLLDAIEADPQPRALVLKGSGGLFCAGADLKGDTLVEAAENADDPVIALSKLGGLLYQRFNACPIPTIAAVDGPAFGGGFGLACCADIVLAGPRARFALSETRLGLLPAQIAPFVLARIGLPAARRLSLTGRRIGPEDAVAIGLADAAYPDDQTLQAGLQEILADVRRCAPKANIATKALFLSLSRLSEPDFADHAADLFAASLRGPEGREGLAAFMEKRNPNWIE